jgi:hypothetical protein
MPKLGEVCHGRDLGKFGTAHNRKFVFVKCLECGSERWIMERRKKSADKTPFVTCHFCTFRKTRRLGKINQGRREKSTNWKGGRTKCGKYIRIRVYEDSPYYPMATKCKYGAGEVPEHRLVMAQHLGRLLATQEHVHHLNGDTQDNRIENLELISQSNHVLYDKLCAHCKVRTENRKLKREIKRLNNLIPKMF